MQFMDNKSIAAVFEEMADILEIEGANFFRINAYRKAALTISNFSQDLRKIVKGHKHELEEIPGIGKTLRDKIVELIETGKSEAHVSLKKNFPPGLLEMLKLRGLGPKKVKMFHINLGINTLEQLKKAAEDGKLRELPKMGEKSESEVLKALEEYSTFSTERSLISTAAAEAERYIDYLKQIKEINKIQFAGSLRRSKETIGDIDILTTVKNTEETQAKIMEHFVNYPEVRNVIAEGETKSSVMLNSGINVDLRVVADGSFGAALHYFTGSKEHNIKMRDLAKRKGYKLNEYGMFEGEKLLAGDNEEELFKLVGMPFVPPEMRRNDGEFEYGLKHGKMPDLVDLKNIRGDLHSHSTYSDGKNSIKEMAEAFAERGYEYFAVTDHSSAMAVTGGMSTSDIKRQWKEIDLLNKELDQIRILKGCEVDILKDGSLDFEDAVLKELEIVVISAHMFGRLDSDKQTARIIEAIENPYSMILGHPTGRLINKRSEMEFDMEKIIDAAVENNVTLEINANPIRLDLAEKYIRIGKDKGVKFAVNTDAHSLENQDYMSFGVGMARRGWLEAEDLVNTKSLSDLTALWGKV
jgi:DNA polymerase (family X)